MSGGGQFGPAGRLADPDHSPATDPRVHPAVRAYFSKFDLHNLAPDIPILDTAPREDILAVFAGAEKFFASILSVWASSDTNDKVTTTVETIKGVDGNDIKLLIYRPKEEKGDLPGVLYLHGGGMTILKADSPNYRSFCRDLAATGMVVVAVEFRNAAGELGSHPFPAGLEDCASALKWVHARRGELGIFSLIVAGDSGGANLSIALTIKAKRDSFLEMINGVYAIVPFISGAYGWSKEKKLAELPSLIENDRYFIGPTNHLTAAIYDPEGNPARPNSRPNPLAWPYHATEEDVAGLPPHVISVDECDPLRDEGIAYLRKLQRAGVRAIGKMYFGMLHAAEVIVHASPEAYFDCLDSIHGFATRSKQ